MGERVITQSEFEAMSEAEQNVILNHPMAKMKGTAVVRRADGSIKYDSDAEPGKYHEKGDDNG